MEGQFHIVRPEPRSACITRGDWLIGVVESRIFARVFRDAWETILMAKRFLDTKQSIHGRLLAEVLPLRKALAGQARCVL